MITSDTNFRGNFDSIEAVWEAIPYGGVEGDYLNIQGVKYRWNKYLAMWENAEVVTETPARETVTFDEDVNMQNNLTVAGVLRAKKFVVDDLPTGIEEVEITESAVSGGNNVITFTYTNGESQTFNVKNGEAGKTMGAFGYASSTASQSTWDTAKNYLVPTATEGEFYVYTYEGGAWYQVDTFQVDIAGSADAVVYDDTTTQLGAGNVQEAIEALNDKTYPIDDALDETSELPVQNKVVTEAFKSVQMPDIDEYSSALSVPSKAQFRIILPFNFVVGETYDIEVSTANALTSSIRFYVYQSGQYSNNTNKPLGEIPAGGTTAKTTYTPVSETNYQFFGFWNYNNAATSVDVTITKKQATNKVVSDMQDVVAPLQLKEFFNDCFPDLEILDYDIFNIKNLDIHDCVVDANNKWYQTAASQGQNAKHIVVPVIDGSIVIMRGKYDVMQFWLNSSYDPNTTYSSGSAPVVGSRQFISGTDAVLYTPTNAAYFAISIVFGDYKKSLMPDEIIVITNYINKSAEPPYITTDFEVGCTNEANLKCVKSEDNIYTFVCYHNVRYNYAYIKIPVVVGHKYKLCFNAAARTKLNTVWNGLMVLKKNNPEDQIDDRNYKAVVLGKTNQEYFEWDFVAEYPIAYMRVKASDLGDPNYGNATIVVKNIKLIDMGKTDMDAVTSILMDGEISAINSILDNTAIIDIVDGGLYVCDRYLNVGGYLDINGIHANNLNS